MRRIALLPFAILICILLMDRVFAETTILFDAANPPFMYERGGSAAGIYPALVSEAFRRIGAPVTVLAIPWKRALLAIGSGEAGIGGVYRTSSRELAWDFSAPIFEETTMLYVLRGGDFRFDSLADLSGKKIGVLRGWSYGNIFDSAVHDGRISVEPESSDLLNFRKLVAGRLDAVAAIRESGDGYSEFMNAGVHRLPAAMSSNRTYIAFNKTSKMTGVIAAFNSEIDLMIKDGTFDRIVNREQLLWSAH
jgi:polar amino acid transport system substrate-binding protein